jgi:hypothetical protein
MSVSHDLLKNLMDFNENGSPKYRLFINDVSYLVNDVSIINSPIPVNEPTTRGGVYFTDKFVFKMKGVINDLSIVPLLTQKMLGPNTEFGTLKITTVLELSGKSIPLEISTNLTNSVQTPNSIELSMIIVNLESV